MDPPLFKRLQRRYCRCPLTKEKFLPLDAIDEEITEDSVRTTLDIGWLSPQRQLPRNIVERAKKVFAVLEIVGETRAIEDLLKEEIADDDLPLIRQNEEDLDNYILVAHNDESKVFSSFANWEDERRVEVFLERQWLVLAPVLDSSGREVKLNRKCALPFIKEEDNLAKGSRETQWLKPVGENIHVMVYRNNVHPAHLDGLQVSLTPSCPLTLC
jgi:hypothetical protein